ncbi:MAG: hypothetical protein Q9207_008293 [Kuettlingeria erythrocarpa]
MAFKPTLCTLPVELRFMIFRYLVPDTVKVSGKFDESGQHVDGVTISNAYSMNTPLALARACKLFGPEIQPMLYSTATLHFVNPVDACGFLSSAKDILDYFIKTGPPPAAITAITSIKLGPDVLRSFRHYYVEGSRLFAREGASRAFCSAFPALKEIRIACRGLMYLPDHPSSTSAVPALSNILRESGRNTRNPDNDWWFLKDIIVIFEPEFVANMPIVDFEGGRSVRFVLRDGWLCLDQNQVSRPKAFRDVIIST